jgi:hypothetical protein
VIADKAGPRALLVPTGINLLLSAGLFGLQTVGLDRFARSGPKTTTASVVLPLLVFWCVGLLYGVAFRPYPARPWWSIAALAFLVTGAAWGTYAWQEPFLATDPFPYEAKGAMGCILLFNLLFTLACGSAAILWKNRRRRAS